MIKVTLIHKKVFMKKIRKIIITAIGITLASIIVMAAGSEGCEWWDYLWGCQNTIDSLPVT